MWRVFLALVIDSPNILLYELKGYAHNVCITDQVSNVISLNIFWPINNYKFQVITRNL